MSNTNNLPTTAERRSVLKTEFTNHMATGQTAVMSAAIALIGYVAVGKIPATAPDRAVRHRLIKDMWIKGGLSQYPDKMATRTCKIGDEFHERAQAMDVDALQETIKAHIVETYGDHTKLSYLALGMDKEAQKAEAQKRKAEREELKKREAERVKAEAEEAKADKRLKAAEAEKTVTQARADAAKVELQQAQNAAGTITGEAGPDEEPAPAPEPVDAMQRATDAFMALSDEQRKVFFVTVVQPALKALGPDEGEAEDIADAA